LKKKVFVVCVDRDNDLGRKTKIEGPVIGREKNLEAAKKLILADPTESDANTMFAAISKLAEAEKEYKNVEIVTLTGKGKIGLAADKEINRQLDELSKEYIIEGWILITDGAEDAQVIPLLQSRAKIISTEQIVIKQAQAVESTFYTIKEALKDPGVARLFLGIPGVMLIAYFALGTYSIQAMALILGTYLMLKGFGIEEKLFEFFRMIISSAAEQRISVVMYVAAMLFPLFGVWLAYIQVMSSEFVDVTIDAISAIRITYPFFAIAALLIITGRIFDAVHSKKTYLIGKYLMQATSVVAVWIILDAGTLVFLRQADLAWFPANIMIAIILLVIAMRVGSIFDIRNRVTKALLGMTAMSEQGDYLGKVSSIDKKKQFVTITNPETKKKIEKTMRQFALKKGRIIVTA